MFDYNNFISRKKKAVKRLEDEIKIGRVDEDIINLLRIINRFPLAYTTSSCSGRIQLIDIPEDMKKCNAKRIAIWHGEAPYQKIQKIVDTYTANGVLWMKTEPLIISIAVYDWKVASEFLALARRVSLKNSGVRAISLGKAHIVVEFLGTERMDIPLKHKKKVLVTPETLKFYVELANIRMRRVKEKIPRLEREFLELYRNYVETYQKLLQPQDQI